MNSALEEYDIIFAGAGAAAGVIAGRLATACPTLRILMLETGPHTQEHLAHVQPARFLSHLRPDSTTVKHVVARPSVHLDGRQLVVSCGRCVGGGSSVNFMMYTRSPASDFDEWANVYDNPGWSFKDLLPLIKKMETFQNSGNDGEHPTHGYHGPLKVSHGGHRNVLGNDFLATATEYDKTRPFVEDANTMLDDVNRHQRWAKWIDKETGRRSDVPHNFIYNNASYGKNLQLLTGCTVKRVIIENRRAVGVEYIRTTSGALQNANSTVYIARATRMIVVSAGGLGSPGILERSGIGHPEVLKRNGVKPVVELPGVGENYNRESHSSTYGSSTYCAGLGSDHPLLMLPFHAPPGTETLDGIIRNDPEAISSECMTPRSDGRGLMATTGTDGGCKYHPNAAELEDIGPAFKERWESFYVPSPQKPIFAYGILAMYVGLSQPPPEESVYCLGGYTCYPSGIGSVHTTSGEDPNAPVDFDAGVLSTPDDLAMTRHLYKRVREIGRRMTCYRGEYAPDHPVFHEGSDAALQEPESALPVALDAPNLVYTAEDDAAIDKLLRSNISTAWHSNGTCVMKPRAQGGVVDPRLNVYGVQGLKVADISICPANVGTNTHSTALTIGEKAAVIIAEELGIPGV
ncbi:alcohol oxidase-like protein [Trametes polyzona]|nr:alcohol oxidase-like protein [Trametes polyzona]